MEDYYRHLYAERLNSSTVVTGTEINRHREDLAFEDTHQAFRMIDETSVAVIVDDGSDAQLALLVERLGNADYILGRRDRRLLNRFTASAPQHQLLKHPELFEQLPAGPVRWASEYDERVGLALRADGGVMVL